MIFRAQISVLYAVAFLAVAFAPLLLSGAQLPLSFPADEIIRRFSEKEQEFKLARESYMFRQEIRVQELDPRGNMQFDLKGNVREYHAVTDILFDSKGQRVEKQVQPLRNTLQQLKITSEDLEDARTVQPFVLTAEELPQYVVRQTGLDTVDEMNCHVFEVRPKRMEKGKRYFEGRVWVNAQDLQIVKTFGKAVPDIRNGLLNENLFARFESYRERIDGKYWFPTYAVANDTLQFTAGPLRIRWVVKYGNYRQFVSDVKIIPQGAEPADSPSDKKK